MSHSDKMKVSKYFCGLSPKRGHGVKFKELDLRFHELTVDLTHFIITDVATICCGNTTHTADSIRIEIKRVLEELKSISQD